MGREVTEEIVMKALLLVIDEMNEERDEDSQLGRESSSTLYGEGGSLDSLDLVRLVVLFEQQINDDCGRIISIADDRAMSTESSHFSTVGALASYASKLMEEDVGV